jgi:hypothetical protein
MSLQCIPLTLVRQLSLRAEQFSSAADYICVWSHAAQACCGQLLIELWWVASPQVPSSSISVLRWLLGHMLSCRGACLFQSDAGCSLNQGRNCLRTKNDGAMMHSQVGQ